MILMNGAISIKWIIMKCLVKFWQIQSIYVLFNMIDLFLNLILAKFNNLITIHQYLNLAFHLVSSNAMKSLEYKVV